MYARLLLLVLLLPLTSLAEDLRILDIGPRTFDDAPALGVVFSAPLDPARRYEGALIVEDKHSELVPGAWILSDNRRVMYFPAVQPEGEYRVWARKGLAGAEGQILAESLERNVTMPALPPAVGFASSGSVLPSRLGRGLPLLSVNVPQVDVDFIKIDNARLPDFLNAFSRNALTGIYDLNAMRELGRSVFRGRFDLHTPKNRRSVTQLPVRDIKALNEPGLYVAVLSRPGAYEYSYQTSYFFVSDLGLHARVYANSIGVYLSSLAEATPVDGVTVDLFDEKGKRLDRAVTDSEGKVRLAGSEAARVLVARRGDDITFLSFNGPALDLSDNAVEGRIAEPLELFAYGPRDLYRSGEEVEVAMLLRDRDGEMVAAMPISAQLRRPDGRLVSEFTIKPRDLGFYQRHIPLPADAQSGQWRLELRIDPASAQPTQSYLFKVEDFLPERLRMSLSSDPGPLAPAMPMTVTVQGDWLWGVPAAGATVETVAQMRRTQHPLSDLKDVYFGNPGDDTPSVRRDLDSFRLDETGAVQISFDPQMERPGSPVAVRLVHNLFEPGGRPITRYIERVLWPAEALVGIRPRFADDQVDEDTAAGFEILRVNAAGERLAAADLRVRLIREDRDYYWRFDEHRGWQREYSQNEYPVAQADLALAEGETGRFEAQVEWGGYRLEVFDPATGLTTAYRFEAGWGGAVTQGARPDKVELSLDKPAYGAGDIATLHVLPPHAGNVLVLVEGDGVLWSVRQPIAAQGADIAIPIADEWRRHDLYISAVVFRPVSGEERITPTRAVGVLHLPLNRSERRLALQIETPEKMRPEQPLTVAVQTDAKPGERVALTVAAVDVGVLNITRFETPDPFAWFFAKRRYGVDMRDLYGDIIETLDGPKAGLSYGGDTELDSAGQQAKAKPRIVSLWSGTVAVDADGRAQVDLPVPDFNGSLRVMAIGFSANRFGASDRETVVAAPVIAELSTPRFLAAGDHSFATLLLQNASGVDQTLNLSIHADAPLSLAKIERPLVLAAGASETVRLPLAAEQAFGEGRVHVSVSGGDIDIQRHWPLTVRPAWPGEPRRQRARLGAGESLQIDAGLAKGLLASTIQSRLSLSDRPPFDLADSLAELLAYPYGCLEQTTSRAWPLLYSAQAVARFDAAPVADADRRAWVESAIQRVAGMQLPNGGFGLWDEHSPEESWLTPFVVDFLRDAREHGFAVPASSFDAAIERLTRRLVQSGGMVSGYTQDPAHLNFAAKAYAGYVLARLGKAPLASLRLLWDGHRDEARSSLAPMHLAMALDMTGDHKRADAAIEMALVRGRPDRVYLGDYGSVLRDRAQVLALLASQRPDHAAIESLVDEVADQLAQRRWLSTQERSALLAAGLALSDSGGKPWHVRIGKEEMHGNGRQRMALATDVLGATIENLGDGPVYVGIDVAGYGARPPVPNDAEVLIERRIYRADGTEAGAEIKAGELLLVHLHLNAKQDVEHALVADLLPAGFEIENTALNDANALEDFQIDGLSIQAARYDTDLTHAEFRDDRYVAALSLPAERDAHLFYLVRAVTPGEYTQPPPLVEDMYRPELRGIGAQSGVIHIK